jgi:DDE superfamily endonuclease
VIIVPDMGDVDGLGLLTRFRQEFHDCLTARADALFELCDAVLCTDGPVVSLPELSLVPVHRRGHGAMYDALARGRIGIDRFRTVLAGLPLPRFGGRPAIAIDLTAWPRPDAECSPGRSHCHRPCRCDGDRKTVPGWPYSVAAALGTGRTSWTAPLDIRRIAPDDDVTEVTATQIRDLLDRLTTAGQLRPGDPPLLIVLDAGYDIVRLTWLLTGLPVHLLGRLNARRVMHDPAPPRAPGRRGLPPRHGRRFAFADPATWRPPDRETRSGHDRYGTVHAHAWSALHPVLQGRGAWRHHAGPLPVVEATIILLRVDRLPGDRKPDPLWLWSSDPRPPTATELDLLWHSYLRRFDLEHTFRFLKQTLGLTRPRPRTPEQADRWAWLILTAYTQLRLARGLVADLRRPWEKPLDPDRTTPGRVRRGFPHLRRKTGNPARVPKPTRPGPGRPKGSLSGPAPRHPVGKNHTKPDTPKRVRTKQPG